MAWGWWAKRGWGWRGPWPGNGPFSYLPPWLRPGWLYGGRGACWRLYGMPGWLYWRMWWRPTYPYLPPYPYPVYW